MGEAYLESLLRLSRHAAQLNCQTSHLVADALAQHLRWEEGRLTLSLACLRGLPPDIAGLLLYRVLRKAELAGARPGRFLDSALTGRHIQAVLKAVYLDRPRLLAQFPRGLVVECTGEALRISIWPGRACRPGFPHGRTRPAVPHSGAADSVLPRPLPPADGTVAVPELGLQVVVRALARSEVDWEDWLHRKSPLEELVDADALSPGSAPLPSPPPLGEGGRAPEGLLLRTREPGDRFRPLNGPGERKLKEFFIDRKVPRAERDRTLLLARGKAVLWVAGLGPSDDVKVHPQTQHLLHLRAEPLTR